MDNLSFTCVPGQVTGFLGPNGAGKSTTMRVIAGLDRPTSGGATVAGAVTPTSGHLCARSVRSWRRGRSTGDAALGIICSRWPRRTAFRRRGSTRSSRWWVWSTPRAVGAGGFSLGMGQRLGIAGALLGDPAAVVLDEPVNGLDPDGVLWIRTLLRTWPTKGAPYLVSSHLMSEMAVTAEHLVIIGRGRLVADELMPGCAPRGGSAWYSRTP